MSSNIAATVESGTGLPVLGSLGSVELGGLTLGSTDAGSAQRVPWSTTGPSIFEPAASSSDTPKVVPAGAAARLGTVPTQ